MSEKGFSQEITLDALFRRRAGMRAEDVALLDAHGRRYTYADALRASDHIAAQIAALGLPPRSSVALLFPNGAELVLTLLGVLRAGHTPVCMPVAWRKADLVRGCREAEAAALITTAHFSAENLPQLAADAATEAFDLSFPCAFGSPLPDGIMPLSLTAMRDASSNIPLTPAAGIATLQTESGGVSFVLHRDEEMIAAGLSVMLTADMQNADSIVSAISPASFSGIAAAFVPWLLSGGTLTLFADEDGLASPAESRVHLVASAGAVWPLYNSLSLPLASVTAVHFAGVQLNTSFVAMQASRIADVYAIGETAVVSMQRNDPALPQPIPFGAIKTGTLTGEAVFESMIDDGENILIRGVMVPRERMGTSDWLECGVSARRYDPHGFYPEHSAQIISIGALRFSFPDLERRIRAAALVSRVVVEQDRILGHRLIIESDRPEATARALLDAGLPRVIANAVRKGEAQKARA